MHKIMYRSTTTNKTKPLISWPTMLTCIKFILSCSSTSFQCCHIAFHSSFCSSLSCTLLLDSTATNGDSSRVVSHAVVDRSDDDDVVVDRSEDDDGDDGKC